MDAEIGAAPPEDEPENEFEGATPPGYDWPTHGGYLGCLMGVMAGVLLGGFLGANLLSFVYIDKNLPLPVFILLNAVLLLGLLIGLGRLGWYLGKRYYRHYPQPAGPTWGESDAVEENGQGALDNVPEVDETPEPVAQDSLDGQDAAEATEQRPA